MIKFQCLSLKKHFFSQKYQFLSLNNIFDAKKPRPSAPTAPPPAPPWLQPLHVLFSGVAVFL